MQSWGDNQKGAVAPRLADVAEKLGVILATYPVISTADRTRSSSRKADGGQCSKSIRRWLRAMCAASCNADPRGGRANLQQNLRYR
jgi:hypothetical protein